MALVTDPFDSPEQLTVCIDLKDPYCHLALPGTLAMLERTQHEQQCRWLPFERHAMLPPRTADNETDRSSSHFQQRDLYRERELQHYAAALQLPLERLYENPDTTVFASALLWLQAQPAASRVLHGFLRGYFAAYWSATISPEDRNACAQLLDSNGADGGSWLSAGPDNALVHDQREALRAAGLFNAPAYLLQGEVYYGRAHLPLIELKLGAQTSR
ncbi:MAG: DsbA family protein [Pseudomonadales bacterium]